MLGVALPADLAEMWPSLDVEEQCSFLADGLEIVAVARDNATARERLRIWTRDDPSVPRNLPCLGNFDRLVSTPVGGGRRRVAISITMRVCQTNGTSLIDPRWPAGSLGDAWLLSSP